VGLGLLVVLCLRAQAEEAAAAPESAPPPDEIVLKNGSRILGTVTEARDGAITIETDFSDTIVIDLEHIASLRTTEPLIVLLEDDTVLKNENVDFDGEEVVIGEGSSEALTYALDQVRVLNPEPWELGQGYKWTGTVDFSFSFQRGNSDIDELDYRLETFWRSKEDRYTLRLNGELDEANDEKNADNWMVIGKYDYFVSDDTYWGFNASAESDEFRDLDLRYLAGPYFGREFSTDPVFMLAAEVGASYVVEDYITADDQEYPAATWSLRMSSDYLGGDSQLYLDQRGIWNLKNASDVVIDTGVGLAFPLLWGLEAAAEILLEYDSGAVAGIDTLDETYWLRFGYSW
jgi:hypothetical protein